MHTTIHPENTVYCIFVYVIWWSVHRNGLNLGSYEKWMIINRFDRQHAGVYTCRPIPPQNVLSPPLLLALGCEYNSTRINLYVHIAEFHLLMYVFLHLCRCSSLHFYSSLPNGGVIRGGVSYLDLHQWCSSTCRELCMVQRCRNKTPLCAIIYFSTETEQIELRF